MLHKAVANFAARSANGMILVDTCVIMAPLFEKFIDLYHEVLKKNPPIILDTVIKELKKKEKDKKEKTREFARIGLRRGILCLEWDC